MHPSAPPIFTPTKMLSKTILRFLKKYKYFYFYLFFGFKKKFSKNNNNTTTIKKRKSIAKWQAKRSSTNTKPHPISPPTQHDKHGNEDVPIASTTQHVWCATTFRSQEPSKAPIRDACLGGEAALVTRAREWRGNAKYCTKLT